MNWPRLGIAVLVGGAIQIVLLLFGLHASLWFSTITGENQRAYWLLNGVYFVVGVACGLIMVRWAPARMRVTVGAAVLVVGIFIGLISPIA